MIPGDNNDDDAEAHEIKLEMQNLNKLRQLDDRNFFKKCTSGYDIVINLLQSKKFSQVSQIL